VLPPDLRNPQKALQVILKLVVKATSRLREDKIKCGYLGIRIRCRDNSEFENHISFGETDDHVFLLKQAQTRWNLPHEKIPFKVSIVVSNLTQGSTQMSFFDNPKRQQINQALDLINNKYGANTLYAAITHDVLSSGKTRIAFNHIPQLKDEFEEYEK
jgi:DNA polymerase-4